MNATAHDLQIRLDAVRRRIQFGREALAAGEDADLSALSGEVQDVSEVLRTAPQTDRETLIRELEAIIIDMNSLQQELSARHGAMGGETAPDDGADD
tara:strand:- start:509 stop:799 length:291 start_codon:yes stop_codon:yes gene_type:complete